MYGKVIDGPRVKVKGPRGMTGVITGWYLPDDPYAIAQQPRWRVYLDPPWRGHDHPLSEDDPPSLYLESSDFEITFANTENLSLKRIRATYTVLLDVAEGFDGAEIAQDFAGEVAREFGMMGEHAGLPVNNRVVLEDVEDVEEDLS